MNVFQRFREAWTVFRGRDRPWDWYTGNGTADRTDRKRLKPGNERSLVNSAYNRIALDVADVEIHHAVVDGNEFYKESIPDSLEDLFNVEANLDQNSKAYTIDLVMSLFDEGVVAEVPVVTEVVDYEPPVIDEPEDEEDGLQHDYWTRGNAMRPDPNWNVLRDDLAYMLPDGTIRAPKTGEKTEIKADPDDGMLGLFGFIGMLPDTDIYKEAGVALKGGYIDAGEDTHTSVPGVFAAGDIRTKLLRQVVTACADGAVAASEAEHYLNA